jgi:D-alanine-D-alanine ligase
VLVQAETVAAAAASMGHQAEIFSCSLDLARIKQAMICFGPDVVVNLVESLDGSSRLLPLFPALLDRLGIAYTGSSTGALWLTTQKVWAKERLSAAGIATPVWIGPVPAEERRFPDTPPVYDADSFAWIVKSLWEHASFGMKGDALVSGGDASAVRDILSRRAPDLGGACFAEVYVDGREFNLSILEIDGKPHVLPAAEIVFEGYGRDRARIVDYRAKWEKDSFEYRHTCRRFDFSERDQELLQRLKRLSLRCWALFGLAGYARIDFRVDAQNRPWVLEINANPCISPDAGFAATLARAKIPYVEAVGYILAAACASYETRTKPQSHRDDGMERRMQLLERS